ncbi:FYVE zinc finger-domain-containing protein [Biscogniauxia marginata]|nr:FYVE zinc finger-domain-containing protein [Biscogniauxia marginata]
MSSVDGGGCTSQRSVEEDHNISDTESGSSYAGSGAPDTPACPYQTSAFFSHECSRYFDCPTHLIERSPTGGGSDEAGPSAQPRRNHDTQATEHDQVLIETGGVPIRGVDREGVPASEGTHHSVTTAPVSHSSSQGTNSTPSPMAPAAEQDGAQSGSGITLQEALNGTSESLGQLSIQEGAPPRDIADERSQQPAESQQSTTSQPTARPPSRLNPIALPFSPQPQRRGPPEFIVPRWQPDAEVTYCPICRTQFSIFVRKHHCRKCGRVVCNSCSPHRIILPHQFIVRPPGERIHYPGYSFIAGEGGIAEFSSLGGGERVRLCNPCVPDPNTSPPQSEPYTPGTSHRRTQSSSSSLFGSENRPSSTLIYLPSSSSSDTYARNRSATVNTGPGPSRAWEPPPDNRTGSHVGGYYHPRHFSPYGRQSNLPPPSRPMMASMTSRVPRDISSLFDLARASSSSSPMAPMERPLPPPPPIPEEDECPICHHELPSRTLPNFEALRESHITSCITAHSTYNPRPAAANGSGSHGTPPPRTARRTGMFPYLATEKDCVDSAECTICLEEFEVGVPMARLECLCRFHRSCINEWFVDHPGRCPVHQHDSFGY